MLTLKYDTFFEASPAVIWDLATNPEKVKQYFFGTHLICDWKKGSPIVFEGEWEGQTYRDKGTILDIEQGKFFRYDYFSSFSGKEDLPENYLTITYEFIPEGNGTRLVITQEGIDNEERKEHSEQNWKMITEAMRKMLEQ